VAEDVAIAVADIQRADGKLGRFSHGDDHGSTQRREATLPFQYLIVSLVKRAPQYRKHLLNKVKHFMLQYLIVSLVKRATQYSKHLLNKVKLSL